MYFMTLPKVRRPSRIPACSTPRSFSSGIMGGGLFGHVHRAIDRDADVGGVQRGRVVDAVAQVANHVVKRPSGPAARGSAFCGLARQNRLTSSTRAQRVVIHGEASGAS